MNLNYQQDINENNLLIEKIQDVVEGNITFDEFMKLIEKRIGQIEQIQQSFSENVAEEDEFVRDLCMESIENVKLCIGDYLSVLENLMESTAEFNKKGIEETVDYIIEGYECMNIAFLGYRNDIMIARGPTTHAGLNTLYNDILLIKEDKITGEDLKQDIELEAITTEGTLAMLSQQESNFFNDGLAAFYTKYSELFDKFDEYFDLTEPREEEAVKEATEEDKEDKEEKEEKEVKEEPKEETEEEIKKREELKKKKEEKLDELLKAIEELGVEYKKIDVDFHYVAYSYEPTNMPMLNLVITTGRNLLEENSEKGMFQYFLDEFMQLFSSVKYRLDSISVSANPTSETEKEESKKVTDNLNTMEEALDGLYQFLENDDKELFEKNAGILVSLAEEFEKSIETLQTLEVDSGKVTCFKCGFKNTAGKMTCVKCRALLPMVEQPKIISQIDIKEGQEIAAETYPTGPQMTVYVKNLYDSGQGLIEGSVELPAFQKVLRQMEARLQNAIKRMSDIPRITPEIEKELGKDKAVNVQNLLKEANADYKEGLDYFAQGLEQFRIFSEDITLENYETAKETIWKGLTALQKSMKIIEKEFKKEPVG